MWCRAASRRQPAEERPGPAIAGRSPVTDSALHAFSSERELLQALGTPVVVVDAEGLFPVAPDPSRTVQCHLGAISRCPAPARTTAALAGVMGVGREHLLLTNGGAEPIMLTGALLGGPVEEPRLLPALPHRWASPMRSTSTGLLGHDGKWHRRLVTVS